MRSVRSYELAAYRVADLKYFGGVKVKRKRGVGWHVRRRTRCYVGRKRRRRRRSGDGDDGGFVSVVKLCRRARRRRRAFWREREETSDRWLETHRWHAKRFRMDIIDGVFLPRQCNDRGTRSAIRALHRRDILIMDLSFWRAFPATPPPLSSSISSSSSSTMTILPGMEFVTKNILWIHPSVPHHGQKLDLLRFRVIGSTWRSWMESQLNVRIGLGMRPMVAHLGSGKLATEGWTGENVESLDDKNLVLVPKPAMLTGGFGSAVDIIVGKGFGMKVWMKLVRAGGMAIGWEQYRQICLEGSAMRFPEDEVVRTMTMTTTTKVVVEMEMGGRGVPRDGAVLFLPMEDDVRLWKAGEFAGRCVKGTDVTVGGVTTGGYSYLRGRGYASGAWIGTDKFPVERRVVVTCDGGDGDGSRRSFNRRREKRTKLQRFFVLFKNPQSRFLRAGYVRFLDDPAAKVIAT